jgi:hypothetical protein
MAADTDLCAPEAFAVPQHLSRQQENDILLGQFARTSMNRAATNTSACRSERQRHLRLVSGKTAVPGYDTPVVRKLLAFREVLVPAVCERWRWIPQARQMAVQACPRARCDGLSSWRARPAA